MEYICKGMLAIRDPETGKFMDGLDLYIKAEDAQHLIPQYQEALQKMAEYVAEQFLKREKEKQHEEI
ncbi:MAG: hypothetical protein R3Y18_00050 [Bacillota bacterium]